MTACDRFRAVQTLVERELTLRADHRAPNVPSKSLVAIVSSSKALWARFGGCCLGRGLLSAKLGDEGRDEFEGVNRCLAMDVLSMESRDCGAGWALSNHVLTRIQVVPQVNPGAARWMSVNDMRHLTVTVPRSVCAKFITLETVTWALRRSVDVQHWEIMEALDALRDVGAMSAISLHDLVAAFPRTILFEDVRQCVRTRDDALAYLGLVVRVAEDHPDPFLAGVSMDVARNLEDVAATLTVADVVESVGREAAPSILRAIAPSLSPQDFPSETVMRSMLDSTKFALVMYGVWKVDAVEHAFSMHMRSPESALWLAAESGAAVTAEWLRANLDAAVRACGASKSSIAQAHKLFMRAHPNGATVDEIVACVGASAALLISLAPATLCVDTCALASARKVLTNACGAAVADDALAIALTGTRCHGKFDIVTVRGLFYRLSSHARERFATINAISLVRASDLAECTTHDIIAMVPCRKMRASAVRACMAEGAEFSLIATARMLAKWTPMAVSKDWGVWFSTANEIVAACTVVGKCGVRRLLESLGFEGRDAIRSMPRHRQRISDILNVTSVKDRAFVRDWLVCA